jgi:hypothetical protein
MKQILIRLDDAMANELRQAVFDERRTATEICRQALAIRLHALRPDTLEKVLAKIGYQEQRPPGRHRKAAVEANGQAPEDMDQPAVSVTGSDWNLDTGG